MLLLAVWLLPYYQPRHPGWGDRVFSTSAWREEAGRTALNGPRGQMLNSLLDRHELVGMPRNDVLSLLGQPDHACGLSLRPPDLAPGNAPVVWYYLGYPPGAWDHLSLLLYFDSAGRVRRWRVWELNWG